MRVSTAVPLALFAGQPPWIIFMTAAFNIAMSWAESIEAPERRQEVMVEVARSWQRKGGQGLSDWLDSSGLPAEARAQIMAPRRGRRD